LLRQLRPLKTATGDWVPNRWIASLGTGSGRRLESPEKGAFAKLIAYGLSGAKNPPFDLIGAISNFELMIQRPQE